MLESSLSESIKSMTFENLMNQRKSTGEKPASEKPSHRLSLQDCKFLNQKMNNLKLNSKNSNRQEEELLKLDALSQERKQPQNSNSVHKKRMRAHIENKENAVSTKNSKNSKNNLVLNKSKSQKELYVYGSKNHKKVNSGNLDQNSNSSYNGSLFASKYKSPSPMTNKNKSKRMLAKLQGSATSLFKND